MIRDTSSMDHAVVASRSTRTVTLIILGVLALIIGAALFPAIRRWAKADTAVDATTLRIGTVTRGDLMRDISVQGRVVASLHPTLFSPGQGIVALKTKAGSQVKRGDVLAVIDSAELRSELVQAGAQLMSMKADLERQKIVTRQTEMRGRQQVQLLELRLEAAKRSLARFDQMFREGLSNKTELEAAQDEVRIVGMELEQARRELGLSRETLTFEVQNRDQQVRRQQSVADELTRRVDELTIRAPFDGMVASVAVQDRDAVAPNAPIVTVVNLDSLELEIALPEEYASDTAIGTPATINFAGRDWPGRVTTISPEVVNSQVAATVAFEGEQPPGLKQSQRLTTRLVFEAKTGVLKVPRGAFLESGGARVAYAVDGQMATRREIVVGAASASEVEIVSGLGEGEKIVISDTTPFAESRTVLLR